MERCPPHQLLKKTKPSQEKTQISSFSNGRNADRVETRETLPRDSLGGVLERASAMRRTPQRGDQRALTRGKTQSEARCSKYGNAEKRRRPGTFSGCFDSVRSKSARRDENGEPSRRLGCPQELLKRAKTQNEHRLRRYATHTPGAGRVLSCEDQRMSMAEHARSSASETIQTRSLGEAKNAQRSSARHSRAAGKVQRACAPLSAGAGAVQKRDAAHRAADLSTCQHVRESVRAAVCR